jgi:hypothetical protein
MIKMTDKFKPYRYEGSIIWSPKNETFLRMFAKRIKTLSEKEKKAAEGNTIYYGGITYLILLNEHGQIRLASKTKHPKTREPVFLSEGGYLHGEK